MTDQTAEDRTAARKAAEDEMRAALNDVQLDGPYEFPSEGLGFGLGVLFGPLPRQRFAVCLRCGAMVVLDDPETRDDRPIERSVRLHTAWHEEADRWKL